MAKKLDLESWCARKAHFSRIYILDKDPSGKIRVRDKCLTMFNTHNFRRKGPVSLDVTREGDPFSSLSHKCHRSLDREIGGIIPLWFATLLRVPSRICTQSLRDGHQASLILDEDAHWAPHLKVWREGGVSSSLPVPETENSNRFVGGRLAITALLTSISQFNSDPNLVLHHRCE